jgi:hypothetical protein
VKVQVLPEVNVPPLIVKFEDEKFELQVKVPLEKTAVELEVKVAPLPDVIVAPFIVKLAVVKFELAVKVPEVKTAEPVTVKVLDEIPNVPPFITRRFIETLLGVPELIKGYLVKDAGITTVSLAPGTAPPDQLFEAAQEVLEAPDQVLIVANTLEVEMMAITIKIEILIECFIVLCIYV